jgi:hypothetical protein
MGKAKQETVLEQSVRVVKQWHDVLWDISFAHRFRANPQAAIAPLGSQYSHNLGPKAN